MLRSIFAITLMFIFAFMAFGSGYIAMLMYWWYALFRPHDWMWWDISAFRIPLIAAAIFFSYALLTKKLPRLNDPISKLIASFAVITIISQIASNCLSLYALTYDHIVILAVAVLITARYLTDMARLVGLLLAISVFFSFHSAAAGLDILINGGTLYNKSVGGGAISGSNAVALASAMMFFMLIPLIRILREGDERFLLPFLRKTLVRKALLVLSIYNLIGLLAFVYATDSRGSALALGVGGLVWMLLQKQRWRWLLAASLSAALVVSTGLVPESYQERIASIFAEPEERDNSAAGRPHLWGIAIAIAGDNKLGVGAGCYITRYNEYDPTNGQFGRNRSVHSSYFNVIAELGFAGILIWLLLNFSVLYCLLKTKFILSKFWTQTDSYDPTRVTAIANGLFASQVTFMVGGNFYEFSYNDITWITFVASAALLKLAEGYQSEASSEQ